MKDIKAQAKASCAKKASTITSGQFKSQSGPEGYAKGGAAKGKGKTQVNVVVTGGDKPCPGNGPMAGGMPIPNGPIPGGMPPLGGSAGPMRKRGGKA